MCMTTGASLPTLPSLSLDQPVSQAHILSHPHSDVGLPIYTMDLSLELQSPLASPSPSAYSAVGLGATAATPAPWEAHQGEVDDSPVTRRVPTDAVFGRALPHVRRHVEEELKGKKEEEEVKMKKAAGGHTGSSYQVLVRVGGLLFFPAWKGVQPCHDLMAHPRL